MTESTSGASTFAQTLAALEVANLQSLRAAWEIEIGPPPGLRSPELVRLNLLWRLQAERHGGLTAEVRARLRGQGSDTGAELPPGARLIREWEGVRHEVMVTEEGFAYGGKTWKSLSGIARDITGVRWNGPRFFGLRGYEAKAR